MRTCSIEGCEEKHVGLGYCSRHYHMFKVHGDPLSTGYPSAGGTPEYKSWVGAKQRCYNHKAKGFHRYGGRGIIVCERWIHDFRTFLKDMGYKPFKGAQIDRIDNDGNYEPGNCRWVTPKENCKNRPRKTRSNKWQIRIRIRKIYQK